MECGDVINIRSEFRALAQLNQFSLAASPPLDLQLLDTMDRLLFAISEEYLNINWTSSTNQMRSIKLIEVYSAIFFALPPKCHVIFTRAWIWLGHAVQHAVTSAAIEVCQTPFLSRVESGLWDYMVAHYLNRILQKWGIIGLDYMYSCKNLMYFVWIS